MKYMGSKARIAKDLAPIINDLIKRYKIEEYIEPFVGGANMIQHIKCNNKFGCDNNRYLIDFWIAIQSGWNPLTAVTMNKEFYQVVKDHKDIYSPKVVALCGLCATYNAKWFGGYARTVKTKDGTFRNYYEEAVRNVLKQAKEIKDVRFIYIDYLCLDSQEGCLIYCDPPYQNTTGYKDEFDHKTYWEWVRKMSEKNIVLCSEYTAPEDFVCVWEKQLTTTLDKSSRSKATEKLFIHKSLIEIFRQAGTA